MKNVGIICGGFSSEFEVSLKSATNIRNHFPEGYTVYLVVLTRDGWYVKHGEEQLEFNSEDFSFNLSGAKVKIDLAVVYIHGDPGENGKVQAYLDIIGIPYLNSGPLASHLSFDKWYCNQFLKGFGFNVADSVYLSGPDKIHETKVIIDKLGLPVFVKPCDAGSSFGIAKVKEESELKDAIRDAFKEGETVVIESFLDGTEVTCGVYRWEEGVEALPVTEIVSKNDFFDYEAKYKGLSEEITPARISEELTEEVQKLAAEIYTLLNLRSIARIDFMIVEGRPHVIEVNTTPGFSNESIVPKMLATAGLTQTQLWSRMLKAEL